MEHDELKRQLEALEMQAQAGDVNSAPSRSAATVLAPKTPRPRPKKITDVQPTRFMVVNGVPVNGVTYVTVSQLLAPVLAAVKEELGVDDYRLVDYGKGPGMLSVGVQAWLAQNPDPWTGWLVVDTSVAPDKDVWTLLAPHASVVVQSLR